MKTAIRKNRNKPYYLQSILYAENGDCEGIPKQLTLTEFCPEIKGPTFEVEELEDDYEKIMKGSIRHSYEYFLGR